MDPMADIPIRTSWEGKGRSESSSFTSKKHRDSSNHQSQGESRPKTSKPQKRAPPFCNLEGRAGISSKRVGGDSKVSSSR